MSSFIKLVQKNNAEKAKIVQEKLKGEDTLYMGDPALHWGVGGYPRGRASLYYGPRGSGKSTFALKGAAAEQKLTNGYVVIFDSERYWTDPNEVDHVGNTTKAALKTRERLTKAGLDWEKVIVISSNNVDKLFGGLKALEDDLIKDPSIFSAFIVDSWGGIESEQAKEKLLKGDVGDAGKSFGGNAKTIGPIITRLLEMCADAGITQFYVQHCMANMDQYGPKWLLLGGQKLQFLVHCIIFVESSAAADGHLLEDGTQSKSHKDAQESIRVGKRIMFRCEKSRNVVEGRKGELFFNFDTMEFALPEQSLFDLAVRLGVVEQAGSWYTYPAGAVNQTKLQKSKMIASMMENKELYDRMMEDCMGSSKLDASEGFEFGEVGSTSEEKIEKTTKKTNT